MKARLRVRHGGVAAAFTVTAALALSACGGSGFDNNAGATPGGAATPPSGASQSASPVTLQVLIASSGDAETAAVKSALAAWSAKTGNTATLQTAQDMPQQLGQAFAGGTPPDLFYLDASQFANYAKGGSLWAYGDQVANKDDFYPSLRDTFTYNGSFYCAPKDFSTLALQINTKMWQQAGLTDADIPKTWDQLEAVAKKLTTPQHAGLVIGDTRDRIGAFMVQAGGWIVSKDGKQVTADTPANVTALTFVKKLLTEGVAKYPKQLDAGWGGEAFGKQKAAMTIEGNWIAGAMKSDYATVPYQTVELPAGPKGKGTLEFTQCWGIAAKSQHQAQALDLVNYLTSTEQQLKFADEFGVMPSRQAAKAEFVSKQPTMSAFVAGGSYGQGPVTLPGWDNVLKQFDTRLQNLAHDNPTSILAELQKNGQDALSNG